MDDDPQGYCRRGAALARGYSGERAATIRAAGLDSLFVGDHHVSPGQYFQSVPTIARLLAEAGEMTVGALFLLPLYHPVLLAEQVGTLATLARGPFVVIASAGDD